VTAIDRHDEVSATWLAARGFCQAGNLDIRRRPVGTSDTLLAEPTGIAERTGEELVAAVAPTDEPDIADAMTRANFRSVGERTTWRLRVGGRHG